MNENETAFVNHWASLVPGRWLHALKVLIVKALSGFLLASRCISHLPDLSSLYIDARVHAKSLQSCPTLCNPME